MTSHSPEETDSVQAKDEEAGTPSMGSNTGTDHNGEDSDAIVIFRDEPEDLDIPVNWKESSNWRNVVAISVITCIT